jgi:hypothetical protein
MHIGSLKKGNHLSFTSVDFFSQVHCFGLICIGGKGLNIRSNRT